MNRDEMIKMAREAGWQYVTEDDSGYEALWKAMRLAYEAGAAAERERIKAERQPHLYGNPLYAHGCPVCGIATTAYACSRGDCPTRITCTFL